MTYWVVLWVTLLEGPFEGQRAFLMYPDLRACEEATAQVSDTLPFDHTLECQETVVPSGSIRPQARTFSE